LRPHRGAFILLRMAVPYALLIPVVLVAAVSAAAERQWQTGTWVSVGTTTTPWVGDPAAGSRAMAARPVPGGSLTEVATYVIETTALRLELRGIEPIGGGSDAFDLEVTVGAPVAFALDGKRIVYVRRSNGKEQRLLLTKKTPRKPS